MLIKQTHHEEQLALSFFGLFAILAILVKVNAGIIRYFDLGIANHVSHLVSPAHTRFFEVIAKTGSPLWTLIMAVLIAIGLYFAGQRLLSIFSIITMFASDAVAWIVKELVRRPRPTHKLLPDSGFSFPSGHVFGAMILVFLTLAILLKLVHSARVHVLITIILIAWLGLVLVSRLYLRSHFASDTLGSLLLASGCWQQIRFLYWRVLEHFPKLTIQLAKTTQNEVK